MPTTPVFPAIAHVFPSQYGTLLPAFATPPHTHYYTIQDTVSNPFSLSQLPAYQCHWAGLFICQTLLRGRQISDGCFFPCCLPMYLLLIHYPSSFHQRCSLYLPMKSFPQYVYNIMIIQNRSICCPHLLYRRPASLPPPSLYYCISVAAVPVVPYLAYLPPPFLSFCISVADLIKFSSIVLCPSPPFISLFLRLFPIFTASISIIPEYLPLSSSSNPSSPLSLCLSPASLLPALLP